MEIFISITLFIIGTVLASFLNATAYRIEKGYKYKDMILFPSSCEKCNKELSWIELIPILGYIIKKGRCSKCDTKINIIYPISELFLGITFLAFYTFNIPIHFYAIVCSLLFLSYFDIESMSIPKRITDVISILFIFISLFIVPFDIKVYGVLLIIFLVFLVINMIKKSFGLGDLIVFIYSSVYFSIEYIVHYVFLVMILGGLFSILLIVMKKLTMKDYIPLLPFITLAFVLTSILYKLDFEIIKYTVNWIADLVVL